MLSITETHSQFLLQQRLRRGGATRKEEFALPRRLPHPNQTTNPSEGKWYPASQTQKIRIKVLEAELAESKVVVGDLRRALTESTCSDQNDIVVAVTGLDCATVVEQGFCASLLCTTCTFSGYCDLSCGFCSPPTAAPTPSKCGESSSSPSVSLAPVSAPTGDLYDGCFDTDNGAEFDYGYYSITCDSFTIAVCSFAGDGDSDFTPSEMCCVCGGGGEDGASDTITRAHAAPNARSQPRSNSDRCADSNVCADGARRMSERRSSR